MKSEVLNVAGMTCGGCVASVKHALAALPGVTGVAVSLPKNQVKIEFDESKITVDAMRSALQSAGYDVAAAPDGARPRGGCCCS